MRHSVRRQIPVVHLSRYRAGTPGEREQFVRTFGDGLKEFGFVAVADHGVDPRLIQRAYGGIQQLFRLPLETKMKYHLLGSGGAVGYTGFGEEHARQRKTGDLKEFWHVGRELGDGHRLRNVYPRNFWPSELPGFKEEVLGLYQALDRAAAEMLGALADYFRLPRGTFSDMAVDGQSVLRLIHYPPLKERFVPGAVRSAEHEDINLITLMCECTGPGLQILTRDGEWLPVDTLNGQIIVDSGDMLSRLTSNVLPATTHRVVNPDSDDATRYSMPFFVHPSPECVLAPLDLKGHSGQPQLPAITADAFLKQRLREIGLLKS